MLSSLGVSYWGVLVLMGCFGRVVKWTGTPEALHMTATLLSGILGAGVSDRPSASAVCIAVTK